MKVYEKLVGNVGAGVSTFVKVTADGTVHVYYDGMHPADGPIVIRPGKILRIDTEVASAVQAVLKYEVILLDEALPGPHAPAVAPPNSNLT